MAYRLAYSDYVTTTTGPPGPTGPMPPGGPFLPLAGGTLVGQLNQTFSAALSGSSFPPGTLGFQQSLTFTGTTSGGQSEGLGSIIPFSSFTALDHVTVTSGGANLKAALDVTLVMLEGEGNGTGIIAANVFRPISPTSYLDESNGTFISALQTNMLVDGSLSGSTALAPAGAFYGAGIQIRQASGHVGGIVGLEVDFGSDLGSTVFRQEGIKIVNLGGAGFLPDDWSAMLSMSTDGGPGPPHPPGAHVSMGISFGTPFDAPLGSNNPVTEDGTLIYTWGGTNKYAMDWSAGTFTALMKMPNTSTFVDAGGNMAFAIVGGGGAGASYITVLSDVTAGNPEVRWTGANAVLKLDSNGLFEFFNTSNQVQAEIQCIAGAVSFPKFTSAASGNILLDVGGTGTGISIGATAATALSLGRSGGALGVLGTSPVAKRTGWTAATGTATRTTFVTSSVTLPVLAEHVKALIDDLTAYGLIGP